MTARSLRIAVNGFRRIGRSVLRLVLGGAGDPEVALINDIAPLETCAYLFQYDSVFCPWPGEVAAGQSELVVDGRAVPFYRARDIRELDLSGVDVLLECTGHAGPREIALRGIDAGARRALVSGPAPGADVTLILGANEDRFTGERIVSNGSCTTNVLAPLLRVIEEAFGITGGRMTTVHCYTGSQPTVDQPRDDLARSRAAALSMVPTTTSAHRLVGQVLPHLADRIEARALRVPTASVSAIDLTVEAVMLYVLSERRIDVSHETGRSDGCG